MKKGIQYFSIDKKNPPKLFNFSIGDEYIVLTFQEKKFFEAKYPKKPIDTDFGSKNPIAVLFLQDDMSLEYILGLTIHDADFGIGVFKNLKHKRLKGYIFQGNIIEAYAVDVDIAFCEKFRQYILDYMIELPRHDF